MTGSPATLTIEDLLREEQWLGGFVRRLVGPDHAEDLIQDTWVAALKRPPRCRGAVRTWLGKVARYLARQRFRRGRVQLKGETAAARPEAVPSTAATVERLATVAVLVQAVMALREPYRTAVLLRHYHGLEIREVARRTGAKEPAVRQRLKRGIDQVRSELRRRYGRDWRGAVHVALLGTARPPAAPTAPTTPTALTAAPKFSSFAFGALLMSKQLLVTSVAGLVLAGLALTFLFEGDSPTIPSEARPGELTTTTPVAAGTGEEPGSAARVEVEADEATGSTARCAGRVLDARGSPVGGVKLLSSDRTEVLAESDHLGRFELAVSAPALRRAPVLDRRYIALSSQPAVTEESRTDLLYVVAPRVHVSGVVVDPDGTALTDVRIAVEVKPLLDFPEPLDRLRDYRFADAEVDQLGSFEMRDLPGGEARLRFERAGYQNGYFELPAHPAEGELIVLRPMRGDLSVLVGRVLAGGAVVPGAVVGLGEQTVHSDAYGAYAIEFAPEAVAGGASLYAGKTGYQTVSIPDFTVPESPARIERDIVLPGPAKSISGIVRGPGGEPLPDAAVMLWEEEPIAGSTFAEELAVDESVEPLPFFGKPRAAGRSDARGEFTVPGLRDREYRLRVFHPDLLAFTSDPIAAGSTGVELRYPERSPRHITGIVKNCDGEPVPGIDVRVNVCLHRSSLAASWQWGKTSAVTDRAGRFSIDAPGDEEIIVSCHGDGILTPLSTLRPGDPTDLAIVVERLCHFRVESAQAAGTIALRDAQGETVQISEFAAGGGSSSHDTFALVDGKTPVLFASELATTMVVRGEGGERIVPIRLVPAEVTLIRL